MLRSQTLRQKSIELQSEETRLKIKANGERYSGMSPDKEDYEVRKGEHQAILNELGVKQTELLGVLKDYQSAAEEEDREGAIAVAGKVEMPADLWTPELREIREIAQKINITDYFKAAEEGRSVQGPAAEYNAHVFGVNRQGDFPIEMAGYGGDILILDKLGADDWKDIKETEHRTALTGTVQQRRGEHVLREPDLRQLRGVILRWVIPCSWRGRPFLPDFQQVHHGE